MRYSEGTWVSFFRTGDLVAEDYSLYWYFYRESYEFKANESDPKAGKPSQIVGIILSVKKRYPDQFFDIPYFVYQVKWFNPPPGVDMDTRVFYEDELILLSRSSEDWENEKISTEE
tara:strand:- start:1431 stop:1778 length:348 start_codon:yes stop_codon:yes gene_type:complete